MLSAGFVDNGAALYAVKAWHYSRTLPVGPKVCIGFFENSVFIGVVIFSRGASANLLKPYGLKQSEGCELTRVALNDHIAPVTKIVKIALALLKGKCPGLKLVVSFADSNQGHLGTIYQAGNWVFSGLTKPTYEYHLNGRIYHNRQVSAKGYVKQFGKIVRVPTRDMCKKVALPPKFRYLMPLDKKTRRIIMKMSKPYPKILPSKH